MPQSGTLLWNRNNLAKRLRDVTNLGCGERVVEEDLRRAAEGSGGGEALRCRKGGSHAIN